MLKSEQILHLLDRCEKRIGQPLMSLRKDIVKSDHWLAMVWELVVLDAALQISDVAYEPGSKTLDFRLSFYDGNIVWLEATFGIKKDNERIVWFSKHPAWKKVQRKEKQAKRNQIVEPVVVCIGTDLERHFGNSHSPGEIGRDEAILSYLANAEYVSAALVAPAFSKFEVFKGVTRCSEPVLIEHPESKKPLSKQLKQYLIKMDFKRWPMSPKPSPKKSPVATLIPGKGAPIKLPEIEEYLLPYEEVVWSGEVYTYHWNFECLKIVPWGKGYALINGNEYLMDAASRAECAQVASELFCPACGWMFGPNGIHENSDHGVPSDLLEWTIISPQ